MNTTPLTEPLSLPESVNGANIDARRLPLCTPRLLAGCLRQLAGTTNRARRRRMRWSSCRQHDAESGRSVWASLVQHFLHSLESLETPESSDGRSPYRRPVLVRHCGILLLLFPVFGLDLVCPPRQKIWDISVQKKTNDSKRLNYTCVQFVKACEESI